MTTRTSRDCTNGNHTSCSARTCACPHHKTRPSHDYSGACSEGDHAACRMGAECACPHHASAQRSSLEQMADAAAEQATECSQRGDTEGSFYARGLRDAYRTVAAFSPRMVTCAHVYCSARFCYVPERAYPELCLDHAAEVSRQTGWSPANSVD